MKVVITQNHLTDYAGSEVVTLELAEYFSRRGDLVTVLANFFANPIAKEFNKLKNVRVVQLPNAQIERSLLESPPDLIWVHHSVMPNVFFTDKVRRKAQFIFHHMSAYHPLEFPLVPSLERAMASKILFNSPETADAIMTTGVFDDVSKDVLGVFGNPAPDEFIKRHRTRAELKQVLVVSNHAPPELEAVAEILKTKGVSMEWRGAGKTAYSRIQPEDMRSFQVIVSIGKTVQYAICSGVPVYCYDHFGGPGYLAAKNYEKAKWYNFSGRGFSKKTPKKIAEEILDDYIVAQQFASELQGQEAQHLVLSDRMEDLFQNLPKVSKAKIDRGDVAAHKCIDLINYNYYLEFYTARKVEVDLRNTINSQQVALERTRNDLEEILNGRLYRVLSGIRRVQHHVNRVLHLGDNRRRNV